MEGVLYGHTVVFGITHVNILIHVGQELTVHNSPVASNESRTTPIGLITIRKEEKYGDKLKDFCNCQGRNARRHTSQKGIPVVYNEDVTFNLIKLGS